MLPLPKKNIFFIIFLNFIIFNARVIAEIVPSKTPAQNLKIQAPYPADLKSILLQGFRLNHRMISSQYLKKILRLEWEEVYSQFWYPNFTIHLDLDSSQIEGIKTSSMKDLSGKISLQVKDYRLFNWGKDYLQFLNKKNRYLRDKVQLTEKQRNFHHELLIAYFRLNKSKKIEKIRSEQLRQASFVYRFSKTAVTNKKINKQEYYLARTTYLKAKIDYQEARTNAEREDEILSRLINAPHTRKYILTDDLDYREIKISKEEALEISKKYNSKILDAKINLQISARNYNLNIKEKFPLPTFTLSSTLLSQTFHNKKNIETKYKEPLWETSISIDAAWSLNDFIPQRKIKIAFNNKELAIREQKAALFYASSKIQEIFKIIRSREQQISILKILVPALQKTFDTIVSNYLDRKTAFINYFHALKELSDARSLMETYKYEHIQHIILLANTMGVDELPGTSFQKLTKKSLE